MVDLGELDPGVGDRLVEGSLAPLEQVRGHGLELCAAEGLVEVDRAVLAHREVLEVDIGARRGRELLLGLLGGVTEALHGDLVLRQVHARGVLHRREEVLDDPLVPVVAAEAVVAGGRLDLDRREAVVGVLADLEEGDVKGATTEVEDEDELVLLALVEAVGQGRRRRLVDDPQDVEPGDLAGLLGRVPLGVVEVCRHRDDGVGHRLAEVGLCVPLELHEGAGADLLSGVALAVDVVGLPVRAHVALDRTDGPLDIGDRLTLGDLADEDLAVLAEGDDARGGPAALRVGDDGRLPALEDGDSRVGGAEVDADRTCHGGSPEESRGPAGVVAPWVDGSGLNCVEAGLRLSTSDSAKLRSSDSTLHMPRLFPGGLPTSRQRQRLGR